MLNHCTWQDKCVDVNASGQQRLASLHLQQVYAYIYPVSRLLEPVIKDCNDGLWPPLSAVS